MRRRLKDKVRSVASAGIAAVVGAPADAMACEVAAEYGLDLSGHKGRQVNERLLRGADLILTLDRTHSQWLARQFPQYHGRVHKLGKWQDNKDIEDPYRLPREVFERVFEEMEAGVESWLQKLE